MSFLNHLLPAWKRTLFGNSANAAILSAINTELINSEKETVDSKILLILATSTGEWLDYFGEVFGVFRRDNENDDDYRDRIIEYVKTERGTIPAIIKAIRDFLQDDECSIDIYEPYTNVFFLNKSKLNGPDHILGYYYTVAVIDVRISRPFPVDAVIEVINAFKPAGVTLFISYHPGSDPNAKVVDIPLSDIESQPFKRRLRIMNGMDNIVRGHLSLTEKLRLDNDPSDVFILNKSKLNSLDRLAGSFSVFRSTYNLATYSLDDLTFTTNTTMIEVLDETIEASEDFYTKTKWKDSSYAEQPVNDSPFHLYMTLDLFTYLETNYPSQLRDVRPDGIYNRDTYLELVGNPSLQYLMRATTSPNSPVQYDTQMLNFHTNEWDTIYSGNMTFAFQDRKDELDSLEPYLSESGLVFTRFKFNQGNIPYNFQLYFFELSFYKHLGVKQLLYLSFYKNIMGRSGDHNPTIAMTNGTFERYDRPTAGSYEPMAFYINMSPETVDTVDVDSLRITNITTVTELEE
ncbi:baseplate protein [Bacillus phage Shbh1]|uniref:Baseplate-like protein n=1 Tax=Bacillus phage Shbh1 TaxID=1796992 RepID=A0A142F1F7_9CAUD|nr:baseplate protein [Bacillus phage Shbh1]AMQ66614.1 baseplate-like protein [Bacillus phage Shbh1]